MKVIKSRMQGAGDRERLKVERENEKRVKVGVEGKRWKVKVLGRM